MTKCLHCGAPNSAGGSYCDRCGQPLETAGIQAPAALTATLAARTSPLAIASLILSFFSLFPVFGILAVVLGHLARSRIRKSGGRWKGDEMALVGLCLGYTFLAAFVLLFLVALPNLVTHREAAQTPAMAVGSLRTINTAEVTYYATYPARGFSATLAQLGPPQPNAQPEPEAADYIDPVWPPA
jgi:ABC-type Fe3+-siderophore transport system permease subunit